MSKQTTQAFNLSIGDLFTWSWDSDTVFEVVKEITAPDGAIINLEVKPVLKSVRYQDKDKYLWKTVRIPEDISNQQITNFNPYTVVEVF